MSIEKRYIPLIIIGILALALSILGVENYFNLEFLSQKRALIFGWSKTHPILFSLALCAAYVISICLTLPLSSLLCLLSGMLYPLIYAVLLGVFSETLGAAIFFFVVRFSLSESSWQTKLSSWKTIKTKIKENNIYYLLFFRCSHLVPYWLINTVAAALKLRTGLFVWTTALGVFPFVFLMTKTGETIKHAFQQGHHFSLKNLFTTKSELFLLGLGLLALIPVILKKSLHKKKKR